MKNLKKITISLFSILALIALIVIFYSSELWFQKTYHPAQYAVGTIHELTETQLVLEGRDGDEQVIFLEDETRILQGRHILEGSLNIGDRILVVGKYDEEGRLKVRIVRTLDSEQSTSH